MKKEFQTFRKVVSILIVMTCVLIGVISILRMVNKNILVDKLNMDNAFTEFVVSDNPGLLIEEETVSISWAKRYPFGTKQDTTGKEDKKNVKTSFLMKIQEKTEAFESRFAGIQDKLEYYYTDALVGYPTFLEAGTYLEENLSWGMPLSIRQADYVILPNGQVTDIAAERDVTEAAENLIAFGKWVEEKEMDFLYVQFPHKVPKYEDTYAKENVENYSNRNADALLSELANADITYVDIRESIYQSGRNHYDCFYRTDHHWKLSAGLFAAGEIADKLDLEKDSEGSPIWSEESYRVERIEKCYLGSYGRNLTRALIEPDDLEIYYPEYKTNLRLSCEEMGIQKTGRWEETLLDKRKLLKEYSYTISQYDAFGYGDRALIKVENLNCDEGKRVLLIKDSFADVLSPYLALGVKELAILDLRMFNGSVESFVEEYAPDSVIVAYNPAVIAETGKIHYNTHKDLWDFR